MKRSVLVGVILILTMVLGCSPRTTVPLVPTQDAPTPAAPSQPQEPTPLPIIEEKPLPATPAAPIPTPMKEATPVVAPSNAQFSAPHTTTTSPPPAPVISEGTSIGNMAPDFQLPTLSGEIVSLKGLRGKPVLVCFWQTGGVAFTHLTYLQQLYDKWSTEGLVVLLINVSEQWSVVNGFVTNKNISMPVLLDTDKKVTDTFRVGAVPTTFFIDNDGIIQQKVIGGFPNSAAIETELRKIMTLPPQAISPLTYEVVRKYVEEDTSVSTQPVSLVRITIKNTDTISGQFKVKFIVEASLISQLLEQTISLAPGESKTIECPATKLGAWDVIITPELKLH